MTRSLLCMYHQAYKAIQNCSAKLHASDADR